MSEYSSKAELKERLINAGIGDRFIDFTLSSFGDVGQRFLQALAPENERTAKRLLNQGFMLYVYGHGAREFAYVLGGALMATYAAHVQALHLSRLSDMLNKQDSEDMANLHMMEVLVVSEFLNTGSTPLDTRSAFRVEDFLLEWTETKGKTIILSGDKPSLGDKQWTSRLLQRISDSFIQEQIVTYAKTSPAAI